MSFSRFIWWILYAVWGVMLALLFIGSDDQSGGGLSAPEELHERVELAPESRWMGVYLQGHKAGYTHTEIEPLDNGGYEIREFSRLAGSMMGVGQQMRLRMIVITDSTLALSSFEGRLEAGQASTRFSGHIRDRVLSIQMTVGGKKTERFLAAPEPIYLSQAIKPLLQAGRLVEGDSLKLAGFDPLSLQMQDLIVTGADLQEHVLWNKKITARKLTTRLAGLVGQLYVDEEGNTIAETGPMGLEMRAEEMDEALKIDREGGEVDFLAIYSVKPSGNLRAPRTVTKARYRISGVNPETLSSASGRQQVLEHEDGVIEVTHEPVKTVAFSEEYSRFISDAPFIESRDHYIRQAAERAVQGAETLSDSLNQLTQWVFHTVKKRPSAGIPSALAVLKSREGDCNEHSVLFTALARSLGIPTRIELGVVYQGKRFFYHAWPACYVNGRWVETDPTFGQNRADAARIAMAAGDMTDAIKLAGIVGKIKIEIISAEYKPVEENWK